MGFELMISERICGNILEGILRHSPLALRMLVSALVVSDLVCAPVYVVMAFAFGLFLRILYYSRRVTKPYAVLMKSECSIGAYHQVVHCSLAK